MMKYMDFKGVIDENSKEIPYEGGEVDNIRLEIIDGQPYLQVFKYIKKTGDHVDVYAKAMDLNLYSIDNLKYLEKLIKEKIWEAENPE